MSAPEPRIRPAAASALDFVPEGTEAARIIREIDWSATPLGDPSTWSPSLRMVVRFLLANRFPLLLWWGPDYIQIYNDPPAAARSWSAPTRSDSPSASATCWRTRPNTPTRTGKSASRRAPRPIRRWSRSSTTARASPPSCCRRSSNSSFRVADRSQGGLGVGLSLVKRLIDLHGGHITLSSDGEGCGTSVEMRLPLVNSAQLHTEATPAPAPPARRIFIVDDNQDAAETLSRLLECDHHTVASAHSGAQALESIRGFRPDVVLLDIGLPGLDGYEVARRIREDPANAGVQLVAISGYGQHADRERARAAGFVEHLVKPLEYAALQRLLAHLARSFPG